MVEDLSKIFVALFTLAIIAVLVSSGQPSQVIGDLGKLLASFVNDVFAAGATAAAAGGGGAGATSGVVGGSGNSNTPGVITLPTFNIRG